MKKLCPCCSGKDYEHCCRPLHNGAFPNNALDLMRSRYCAYAYGLDDYIIKTTLPKGKSFQEDKDLWKKDILHFSNLTEFNHLEIVEFIDGTTEAYVTFIAHLRQNDKPVELHEKSHFIKVGAQWFYLEAI